LWSIAAGNRVALTSRGFALKSTAENIDSAHAGFLSSSQIFALTNQSVAMALNN
jgi:hypothetical protein